jgi:hypothetical protein
MCALKIGHQNWASHKLRIAGVRGYSAA